MTSSHPSGTGMGLPAPPAAGLSPCQAAWQPSRAERRRQRLAVAGLYATLVVVVAAVWRSPAAAAVLVVAGVVHGAATGRTRLAAGRDWLATGRRWVRLDQLVRVRAVPGPAGTVVHLTDAHRRAVSAVVGDLAREPRLLEVVAAAVADAEHRGAVRLSARTRACLYGPRRRRPRRRASTTDQEGRRR